MNLPPESRPDQPSRPRHAAPEPPSQGWGLPSDTPQQPFQQNPFQQSPFQQPAQTPQPAPGQPYPGQPPVQPQQFQQQKFPQQPQQPPGQPYPGQFQQPGQQPGPNQMQQQFQGRFAGQSMGSASASASDALASVKKAIAALPIRLSLLLRILGVMFFAWAAIWAGPVGFYDEDIPALIIIFLIACAFFGAEQLVKKTELDSKQGNFDSGPASANGPVLPDGRPSGMPKPADGENPAPMQAQFSVPVNKSKLMNAFAANLNLPQESTTLKVSAHMPGFETDCDGEGTGMIMMRVGNDVVSLLAMVTMITEAKGDDSVTCTGGAYSVAWKNTRGLVDLAPHVNHFFDTVNRTVEQFGGEIQYVPTDLDEPVM